MGGGVGYFSRHGSGLRGWCRTLVSEPRSAKVHNPELNVLDSFGHVGRAELVALIQPGDGLRHPKDGRAMLDTKPQTLNARPEKCLSRAAERLVGQRRAGGQRCARALFQALTGHSFLPRTPRVASLPMAPREAKVASWSHCRRVARRGR